VTLFSIKSQEGNELPKSSSDSVSSALNSSEELASSRLAQGKKEVRISNLMGSFPILPETLPKKVELRNRNSEGRSFQERMDEGGGEGDGKEYADKFRKSWGHHKLLDAEHLKKKYVNGRMTKLPLPPECLL